MTHPTANPTLLLKDEKGQSYAPHLAGKRNRATALPMSSLAPSQLLQSILFQRLRAQIDLLHTHFIQLEAANTRINTKSDDDSSAEDSSMNSSPATNFESSPRSPMESEGSSHDYLFASREEEKRYCASCGKEDPEIPSNSTNHNELDKLCEPCQWTLLQKRQKFQELKAQYQQFIQLTDYINNPSLQELLKPQPIYNPTPGSPSAMNEEDPYSSLSPPLSSSSSYDSLSSPSLSSPSLSSPILAEIEVSEHH
jgi:hypothetical protein